MNKYEYALVIVALTVISVMLGIQDRRLNALENPSVLVYPEVITVVVGQGCLGAQGPNRIAVALEEDELPACEAIDAHDVAVLPR